MRALCPGGQPSRPDGGTRRPALGGQPRPDGGTRRPALVAQPRQDLVLVEIEEAVLLGSDLMDADVGVSGARRIADRAEMRAWIGAAHDLRRDLLLGELRERGCEVFRQ